MCAGENKWVHVIALMAKVCYCHFIDFDNTRARQRTVQVMVIGE